MGGGGEGGGCIFSVKQDKMECDDETASIFALRHY